MAEPRFVLVECCGDCPNAEMNDWCDKRGRTHMSFECLKLDKIILRMGAIKKDCPLPKMKMAEARQKGDGKEGNTVGLK